MNKKILYFFITSTAPAALLAGPYAGVHGGIGFAQVSSFADTTVDDGKVKKEFSPFGSLGIQGGYEHSISDNFDLSYELAINFMKKTHKGAVDDDPDATATSTIKEGITFRPSVALHYKVNAGNKIYLRAGVEISKINHELSYVDKTTPANNRTLSKSLTKISPLLGLGHSWSVGKNLGLNCEIQHVFRNSKKPLQVSTGGVDPNTRSVAKSKTSFLVALNYKF